MNFNYLRLKKRNSSYIIAEIGVNHGCSIKKAKEMISLAKKGGADAAKFQTYKANTLAKINSKAYWNLSKEKTKSQHQLFSKFDKFDKEEYEILAKYCKRINIDFLSTPFDLDAVDFLNPLVPLFKISSSDITNYPLLKKISKTKKPILLSTGASSINEIREAVKIIKSGTKKIVIMHCILSYPTTDINANLNMILDLKKSFPNYVIGYSDHTTPDKNMLSTTTAYLLGAKVIEKHFTFNKKLKGNDHYHSMDVKDLKVLKSNIYKLYKILGIQKKKIINCEFKSRKFARRCIVAKKHLKKNQKIKEQDLITLRPNTNGVPASSWDKVIGKKLRNDIPPNKELRWKDIYI